MNWPWPWYAWTFIGVTAAFIGVVWYFLFRRRR